MISCIWSALQQSKLASEYLILQLNISMCGHLGRKSKGKFLYLKCMVYVSHYPPCPHLPGVPAVMSPLDCVSLQQQRQQVTCPQTVTEPVRHKAVIYHYLRSVPSVVEGNRQSSTVNIHVTQVTEYCSLDLHHKAQQSQPDSFIMQTISRLDKKICRRIWVEN